MSGAQQSERDMASACTAEGIEVSHADGVPEDGGTPSDAATSAPDADEVDVTVIIPCYNTERFLDQALSSAEQNARCRLEILVLNDGSTDESLAIMRAHEARDPRVRVIDKANQGYGATINRGIDEARGVYVAILEPDDWVQPHMYDDLFAYARSFPQLPDIVKSPYWRVWMPTTTRERLLHCSYYRRVDPPHQPFTDRKSVV